MIILQFLIFAIVRNGQCQPELRAPLFNLIEEEVHISCIKAGCVARLVGGDLLAGNEVGICNLFAAKVSALEVALYPIRCGVDTTRLDEVFADLAKPHMDQAVL
ncbi:hypothetical protein HA45_10250 [Pantoea rodasii]|nr:hypothetical protein HA45_10250 [Pantoea rodasii]